MSLSRYNRIFNLSIAVVIFYTVINVLYLITSGNMPLGSLVKTLDSFTWHIYSIFALGTLAVKARVSMKYFIGARSTIINIVLHAVFSLISIILVLVNK